MGEQPFFGQSIDILCLYACVCACVSRVCVNAVLLDIDRRAGRMECVLRARGQQQKKVLQCYRLLMTRDAVYAFFGIKEWRRRKERPTTDAGTWASTT